MIKWMSHCVIQLQLASVSAASKPDRIMYQKCQHDAWVIVSDLQMSILLNFASFFSFKTFCKNSKHWIKIMLYFDWLTEERWRMVSSHLPKCHGFQEHHHTQNYALPSSKRIYCWRLRKDQFSFLLNYFSFQTSLNKNLKYFGHLKD